MSESQAERLIEIVQRTISSTSLCAQCALSAGSLPRPRSSRSSRRGPRRPTLQCFDVLLDLAVLRGVALVDCVLPAVLVRQYVLAFPF